MLDPDVLRFVTDSLPSAPARVLEVGAGEGELARALISAGYDVLAIDPAGSGEPVRAVALAELDEPPASFDAAIAVVSLHHVEPLGESLRRLAEVVRPGGALVLDEIDVDCFDERAARWWLEHGAAGGHRGDEHGDHAPGTPEEIVAFLRHHIHDLVTLRDALAEYFELGPPVRGPYLYRWELPPDLQATEVQDIAAGLLPAVGVRIVGLRRPGRG
jgi:SAM-dependent methyltransferase